MAEKEKGTSQSAIISEIEQASDQLRNHQLENPNVI